MAAPTVTATVSARTGSQLDSVSQAVNGTADYFTPGATDLFVVTNGSGSPINVTFQSNLTVDGVALGNLVVAVAAGKSKVFGPFSGTQYVAAADGNVKVTYSATATVTCAVIRPGS